MKKFVLVLALVAIFAAGTAFADHPNGLGIGVVGGFSGGWSGGGGVPGYGLSLKLPSMPIFWVANFSAWSDGFWLGLRGDNYRIDDALVDDFLHWYFGLGGYGSVLISSNYTHFDIGVRVPIGLSLQLAQTFEFFIEFAPSIGVYIGDSIGLGGGWGGAGGIRLWF